MRPAQSKGGFHVAGTIGNGEAVIGFGNSVLGIAAVDLVAGEARLVRQVLAALAAVGANAAGMAEPRMLTRSSSEFLHWRPRNGGSRIRGAGMIWCLMPRSLPLRRSADAGT